MLLNISLTFFSVFLALFLFWKKLKEDYPQNQIFTTGFYSLMGTASLSIVADNFFPNWWFWVSLAGSFMGIVLGIIRFKLRFFEMLEAWVIASLPLLFFVFLSNWIGSPSREEEVGLVVIVSLFFLFIFLDKHYKKFTWYRSGRIGFTGLSVLGLFFLIRTLVAITFSSVLSFVGNIDAVLSGVLAFSAFITLYNLSRGQA